MNNKLSCYFCIWVSLFSSVQGSITSDSDQNSYRSICAEAVKDASIFQTFKQNKNYNKILERYPYDSGLKYLELIIDKFPYLLTHINEFKKNDTVGNPLCFTYRDVGEVSACTLEYIYQAGNILEAFGDLTDKSIVEIGGGYGGQCLILSKICKWSSYTIYDLIEPAALINKYLSYHSVENAAAYSIDMISKKNNFDVLISNYAFSECRPHMQDAYFEKVFSKVREGGYMILNISEEAYSQDKIIQRLIQMGFVVTIEEKIPKNSSTTRRIIFKRVN